MANAAFLNFVNDSLIHSHKTHDGKRTLINVSVPCSASESGYGTITVSEKQLLPAKNHKGVVKEGYHSVILGNPEKQRRVSVKQNGSFADMLLTNAEIKAAFDNARNAYTVGHKAEAAASA